jgi:hypothetical protein
MQDMKIGRKANPITFMSGFSSAFAASLSCTGNVDMPDTNFHVFLQFLHGDE